MDVRSLTSDPAQVEALRAILRMSGYRVDRRWAFPVVCLLRVPQLAKWRLRRKVRLNVATAVDCAKACVAQGWVDGALVAIRGGAPRTCVDLSIAESLVVVTTTAAALRIMRLFRDAGASWDDRGELSATALEIALMEDQWDMVEGLLRMGAEPLVSMRQWIGDDMPVPTVLTLAAYGVEPDWRWMVRRRRWDMIKALIDLPSQASCGAKAHGVHRRLLTKASLATLCIRVIRHHQLDTSRLPAQLVEAVRVRYLF